MIPKSVSFEERVSAWHWCGGGQVHLDSQIQIVRELMERETWKPTAEQNDD